MEVVTEGPVGAAAVVLVVVVGDVELAGADVGAKVGVVEAIG